MRFCGIVEDRKDERKEDGEERRLCSKLTYKIEVLRVPDMAQQHGSDEHGSTCALDQLVKQEGERFSIL